MCDVKFGGRRGRHDGTKSPLSHSAAAAPPAPPNAPRPGVHRSTVPTTSLATPDDVATWLTAAKCDDVAMLSVSGRCAFADAMVVATARSGRHALMAAEAVAFQLKERAAAAGVDAPPPVEGAGEHDADWLLVDAGATLAHVFAGGEARDRYGLERLWGEGGEVDAPLSEGCEKSPTGRGGGGGGGGEESEER